MDRIEEATKTFLSDPNRVVNGIITIPVVFHIVWNTSAENISDAQIASQLQILTDDFRRLNSDADGTWSQASDTEIEFCMASVDPNGNSTNGITRTNTSVTSFSANDNMKFNSSGGHDAWPAGDYLNFWVCDLSGGLLGYAQFPGGAAATDGVVCDYQYVGNEGTATAPFNLGRTATHEVGHWLNLRHIWGDGGCSVDDFVNDTPTSDASNGGCALGHVSCGSVDMVQNYMDYSDDACMNLYTQGQKDRMRALFEPGGFRESLLSSAACGTVTPPTCDDQVQNGQETGVDCGGPSCPACPPCNGSTITLTITFDNYPEETSWSITNANGGTVASGGTYPNQPDGSTLIENIDCLADGCYDFTILDSYGDGICCSYGNGSYSVTDANGNTLASGGQFANSETTNFCLNGSPPPVIQGCTDPNAHNYDPNATVDDGSCETCDDGVLNGDETETDCGGALCAPCNTGGCTDTDINFNNFDSGWGIWNDGGSDCRRSSRDANYAYTTPFCVRLRDNTSTSTMTTDNLNLADFEEVTVDFTYYPRSMENNEDFWLQVSTNGGGSYTTVASWASGQEFVNNTRYFETVVLTGTFAANTRFRFRCDASGNSDYIYIDDVNLTGCTNGTSRVITEENLADIEEESIDAIEFNTLYPNPASTTLNIKFTSTIEKEATLTVFDVTGKLVHSSTLRVDAGVREETLDVSQYGNGIYFLQLTTDEQRIVKKFVVTKQSML